MQEPETFGPSGSRFALVSRRAFLTRSMGVGGAVIVLGLAACGPDDAEVFARGSSTTGSDPTTPSTDTTTTSASTSSGATSSTSVVGRPTTAPTAPSSTTATADGPATTAVPPTASAAATLAGSELVIRFTYAVRDGGGRVSNPYVAVWIEDHAGELVDTIALWFLQQSKGTRWLDELRRWESVDGSTKTVDTISSATRTPGDYSLTWHGTDLDGRPVVAGEHFVCIEAAREHGPYSLVRRAVTLGSAPMTTALDDDGEITGASLAFTPA